MFRISPRGGLVSGALLLAACGGTPSGPATRVIVPRGSSFGDAADSLAKARLISYPKLFRIYGRLTGGDRNIKPGTYLLRHDTPWSDIVSALNGGHGLVNTITIPEGYTISQITPLLARTISVPVDSVKAAMRDTALLRRLDVPTPTLEGYVFPDTYAFPIGTTARQAVREMVYAFERRWRPQWDSSLVGLKINRNDLVTMASIVEREARLPEERPVIAAVYYNRLRKGMLLQADPTVQYALGHHVGRVLYKDLAIQSPYNTYVHKGLPPGPVASPGVASLAAAANPANVPYLYFVASPDGHHEFRMTLAEHTSAIKQVRIDSAPKTLASARKGTTKTASTTTSRPPARTASKSSGTTARVAKLTSSKTSNPTAKKTTKRTTAAKSTTTRKKRTTP
ncbi:MAG: endolytic transglycosylase MltG [Gemmatimonadaceae bacterium]